MKKTASLLAPLLLLFSVPAFCQPSDSLKKAEEFKKELADFLSKKAVYPERARETGTWGDVILSCKLIEGGISEPAILKSPDPLLSTGSVVTMYHLKNTLAPGKNIYIPLGKEYHFVFRYRIYMNVMPVDNKSRAVKLFNEAKYEKAVKLFDKSIKDNEYDHELYGLRARCREFLGDKTGAAEDYSTADRLRNEVMAVIDVIMLGKTQANTPGVRLSGDRVVAVPVR